MANQPKVIKQKANPKSIWEATVLRKSYEPSLYFLHFQSPLVHWIKWEIAYTQDDAEAKAINEFKREAEQLSVSQDDKKKRQVKVD